MIIAIIGADGAGKSTTAELLAKTLSDEYNAVYEKAFEEYFILNKVLKLFKNKRDKLMRDVFVEATTRPNLIIRYIWPVVIYLDQLLLYIYIKLFKRHVIFVSDRYLYSFAISWQYYGISNRLVEYLYFNFPQPDICILLYTDAETLMKRKGYQLVGRGSSYRISFFRKHLELYNKLQKRFNFPAVNTTLGLPYTLECSLKIIKEKLN